MTPSADLEPGRLIVLEGVDGCGKSTQAARLAKSLGALLTVEPGATALGRQLRSMLLDPERPAPSIRAEALLMTADRAQHVEEVIKPALLWGSWVVCDRFSASTLAYQGFGRGLDIGELRAVTSFAAAGLEPALQVLLDLPIEVARKRMKPAANDRLERLGDDFFEKVREGYLSLASADPERWVILDATMDAENVESGILDAVIARLGQPPEDAQEQ
jgi:dTMP kinase